LVTASLDVLLVDDDPADILMVQEVFEDHRPDDTLHAVHDGVQAVEFLRQAGEFTSAPRPDLILLDLNLPRLGGLEVLAELKADDNLRTIPVVVLTTSNAPDDIMRSYQLHASAYVTKPMELERFTGVIRHIDDFYLSVATLPRTSAGS
jgi:CheY-like chemotaxis protein